MADIDPNETEDERIDRIVSERLKAREAEADRAKRMKTLGLSDDLLDVLADAIWDRGEKRAAERKAAAEAADQAPSTGTGKSAPGFMQRLGIIPATGTDE